MPIWTDTALPSTVTTVLPFMYQPKLPVENCFTSASISWPLIETLSGSAFSRNWVSETGQEVLGGMTFASDQKLEPRATVSDSLIKTGTAAWADRILVDTGWYPADVRSPEDKLRYYASQFPLVENDSTYWAFPDRERVATWAERTPDGFTMNMKAHALLTAHYAAARGLPRDIRESLPRELRDNARLYPRDLGDDVMRELSRRFRDALEPLHEAGRLGVVLFQFPVWFPISAGSQGRTARDPQGVPPVSRRGRVS
jgi:hypothetical protein